MPLIKSRIIVFIFVWLFANQIDSYAKIEIGDVNKLTQSEKIKASKLYKEYENNQDNYSKQISIIEEMMGMGRLVAQTMFERIDRELRKKWPLYQKFYVDCAKKAGFKKTTPSTRQEILTLEQKVQALWN